mmetsp:Transcript_14112/g.32904  ORF Transcript_14112/g.32904 Transcript_14112/m.32904 type:complete len:204 (+) Transcript_14112:130-741(+)
MIASHASSLPPPVVHQPIDNAAHGQRVRRRGVGGEQCALHELGRVGARDARRTPVRELGDRTAAVHGEQGVLVARLAVRKQHGSRLAVARDLARDCALLLDNRLALASAKVAHVDGQLCAPRHRPVRALIGERKPGELGELACHARDVVIDRGQAPVAAQTWIPHAVKGAVEPWRRAGAGGERGGVAKVHLKESVHEGTLIPP